MADHSPFDIPEIRDQIAQFLSTNDVLSCSVVCKSWSHGFTRRIWRKVDFNWNSRFNELDPKVISKHGRHIRVVERLSEENELNVLQDSSIRNLNCLRLILAKSPRFRSQAIDVIRRNRNTIKKLAIQDSYSEEDESGFDFVDALIPSPRTCGLTELSLDSVYLTQESFSLLLAGCPLLDLIKLEECTFQPCSVSEPFKNYNVTHLIASISQIRSEISSLTSSSLSFLEHFPNLKRWDVHTNEPMSTTTADAIRYKLSNQEVVLGLLFHKDSLKYVHGYHRDHEMWTYDTNTVPVMEDHFSESGSGWVIQLLTMNCPNLESLILPLHEMDVDYVERFPWACKNLKELRVRFKGLGTKESILGVTEMWREAQRARTRGNHVEMDAVMAKSNSMSVKDKVTRHLLQFPKLNTVWLGHRTTRAY
ncbi:hypothetical protein BGX27_003481 [Mortierella sp. AM989]|nr:hypothetical protein BGX27_003481 [Mortierella sp. AM989]